MMHEFKFGDIVRHKQTGAVFVVSDLEEMEGGYLPIEFDGSFFLNSTEPMDEFNNYPELRTIMDEIIKETEGDKCK